MADLTADAVAERAALVAALLQLAYLTADEAGVIAHCSASTIRRECAAGRLRGARLASKQWRITPDALRAWLDTPKTTLRGVA